MKTYLQYVGVYQINLSELWSYNLPMVFFKCYISVLFNSLAIDDAMFFTVKSFSRNEDTQAPHNLFSASDDPGVVPVFELPPWFNALHGITMTKTKKSTSSTATEEQQEVDIENNIKSVKMRSMNHSEHVLRSST